MRYPVLLLAAVGALSCGMPGSGSGSNGGGSLPDPDGNWQVTAHVTSCMDATGTATVQVTGGSYNAQIFSYNLQGCSQAVSIQGTLTKGNSHLVVEGNEFLTGGCCNGGNGYFGYLELNGSSVGGMVSSAWGSLDWKKL